MSDKNKDEGIIQKTAKTEPEAITIAIELSREKPELYAAVVLSNGIYYIENRVPFVRIYEKVIGQWEHGKLVK